MTIEELDNIRFNFIVARGRSGTTLLRTMMNAHSSVISPIESKLIIHLKKKFQDHKQWTKNDIEMFLDCLYQDIKFQRFWNIDREYLKNRFALIPIEKISFQRLIKLIYLSFPVNVNKNKISMIIDKNPPYALFLEQLNDVFPEAKYIHLMRDYRDNVQSAKKTNPIKNVALLAQGWLNDNAFIEKFKKKYPEKFFTLKYEELVNSPESFVRQICEHFGLDYEQTMIHYQESLKQEIDQKTKGKEKHLETFQKFHSNLIKPVGTDSVNKWKKYLTNEEVLIVEYICKDYGVQYGYQPTQNKVRWNFFAIKEWAYIRYMADVMIVRSYYALPFFIRNGLRQLSNLMFKFFRFTTVYNRLDYSSKEE